MTDPDFVFVPDFQLAVKIMDRIRYGTPEHSGGTDIDKEVSILQTVDHHITKVLCRLTGGDLFDYILKSGPMPELEAKFTVYQILQALQIIMTFEWSVIDKRKLDIDFLALNRAPEVFDVKHAQGPGYGYSADCWSLGVTLYVILSGTHPFTANYATEDEKTMRYKMRNSNISFPMSSWNEVSLEARVLIKKLLAIDPEQRWSVEAALNSAWIQKDLAWLRQRYRESVLAHWNKSSRYLDTVRQYLQMDSQVVPLERALSEHTHNSECEVGRQGLNTVAGEATSSGAGLTSTDRVPDVSM
ncbi:hypothetical protein BGX27_002707 [Mortierella sp. AM989]|nr:hypothetical protein BGX27_002707 [Mortierella sp. AM989]